MCTIRLRHANFCSSEAVLNSVHVLRSAKLLMILIVTSVAVPTSLPCCPHSMMPIVELSCSLCFQLHIKCLCLQEEDCIKLCQVSSYSFSTKLSVPVETELSSSDSFFFWLLFATPSSFGIMVVVACAASGGFCHCRSVCFACMACGACFVIDGGCDGRGLSVGRCDGLGGGAGCVAVARASFGK